MRPEYFAIIEESLERCRRKCQKHSALCVGTSGDRHGIGVAFLVSVTGS
jgi:hypothetical protein